MLVHAAQAVCCAWLAAVALTALATRWWRPAPGRASLTLRGEPPAVVSLLAGRLERDGYHATVLDLAARGWIRLGEAEPSRVMCLPVAGARDDTGLTDYERRVVDHLEFRAAGLGVVPGTALDSGFEIGDDEFRTQFETEVRADASRRGLIRSRIRRGTLSLFLATGVACAGLTDVALALHRAWPEFWTVSFVFLAALRAPWALYGGIKMTPEGRAALAEWLGFRVALIGSRSARTAGTALLAAAGDRRIAYAAALGAAPDAAAAFSASADRDHIWSSFGGSWHRVRFGKPLRPKYVPSTTALAVTTALGFLFAAMDLLVLKLLGPLWAAGFLVIPGWTWWGAAFYVYGNAVRASRLPLQMEFDGQILNMSSEAVDEDGNKTTWYRFAVDDGMRDQAWDVDVDKRVYERSKPGMLVHVQLDPRRNRVVAVTPVGG